MTYKEPPFFTQASAHYIYREVSFFFIAKLELIIGFTIHEHKRNIPVISFYLSPDASKDNKKTTTNEKTPSTNNTKNTPSKDLETDIIDQYDNNDTAQDEASTDKVDSENVHEDIDLDENGEDLEGIDDDKDIEEDDHTHDEPMDTTEDNREQVADVPITLTEDTSTLQGKILALLSIPKKSLPV